MASYRLTPEADQDIADIYEYSFVKFGEARADRYVSRLFEALGMLAQYPHSGRDVGRARPNSRALVHESHVIYYRRDGHDVLIHRILHQSQDPLRHL